MPSPSDAAIVIWDGGGSDNNWSTVDNWDGSGSGVGGIPGIGDTVRIANGDTVNWDVTTNSGSLPSGVTIDLSGNSVLSNTPVIRLNGATINVASGSVLGGGFWDLNNGTINFSDGANATMGNWENKGTNTFRFTLSSSGFSALNPGTFRNDGNNNSLSLAQKMALATYEADLANYTGGAGVFTLIDYSSDATGLDNATFQNATLNVLNVGNGLQAGIAWNAAENSVQLTVAKVPEPSSIAILGIAAIGLIVGRRFRAKSSKT